MSNVAEIIEKQTKQEKLQAKLKEANKCFLQNTSTSLQRAETLLKELQAHNIPDALYNLAICQLKQNKLKDAMASFQALAIAGDTEAELQLALNYMRQGRFEEGVPHLTKLSKKQVPLAQYNLGVACEKGNGLPLDIPEASIYYLQAASALKEAATRFSFLEKIKVLELVKGSIQGALTTFEEDLKINNEIQTLFKSQAAFLNQQLKTIHSDLSKNKTALNEVEDIIKETLAKTPKGLKEKQMIEAAFEKAEIYFKKHKALDIFYSRLFNKLQSLFVGNIVLGNPDVQGKSSSTVNKIKMLTSLVPIFGISALGSIAELVAANKAKEKTAAFLSLRLEIGSINYLVKHIAACLAIRYEAQILKTTPASAAALADCVLGRIEAFLSQEKHVQGIMEKEQKLGAENRLSRLTQAIMLGMLTINKKQGALFHLRNKEITINSKALKKHGVWNEAGLLKRPIVRTPEGFFGIKTKSRGFFSKESEKALFYRANKYGFIVLSSVEKQAFERELNVKFEPFDLKDLKTQKHFSWDLPTQSAPSMQDKKMTHDLSPSADIMSFLSFFSKKTKTLTKKPPPSSYSLPKYIMPDCLLKLGFLKEKPLVNYKEALEKALKENKKILEENILIRQEKKTAVEAFETIKTLYIEKNDRLEKELASLRKVLGETEKEGNHLKSQHDVLQQGLTQKSAALCVAEQRLKEIRLHINGLMRELEVLRGKDKDVTEKLFVAQDKLQSALARNIQLENTNAYLRNELDRERKEHAETQAILDTRTTERNAAIEERNAARDERDTAVGNLATRAGELAAERNAAPGTRHAATHATLATRIGERDTAVADLATRTTDRNTARTALAALQTQYARSQAALTTARDGLAAGARENKRLSEGLAKANKKLEHIKGAGRRAGAARARRQLGKGKKLG